MNEELIPIHSISIDPNEISNSFGLEMNDVQIVTNAIEESTTPILAEVTNEFVESINNLTIDSQPLVNESAELISTNETTNTTDVVTTNSESYNVNEVTSRFSGATWFQAMQKSTVLLAGVGGIGSWIHFLLARMDVSSIHVYDNDIVEIGNLSGQFYSVNEIGMHKTEAMNKIVQSFCDYYKTFVHIERFTKDTPAGDIMICGFDNMEARKTFYNVWKTHVLNKPISERKECLFIDGRLSAEEFQIYCIQGNELVYFDKYEETLFNDNQALHVQCSYKQTSYCANMIASVIVNLFTNFITNCTDPIIKRDLPFKTYYDASLMFFKTEY